MDDSEISRIHAEFLDDPAPTDVITFPGDDAGAPDDGERFAGEICVCAPRAFREAAAHGLSPSEELTLYLVHGFLHLAGFDDRSLADRAAMRDAERECIRVAATKKIAAEHDFSGIKPSR